MTSNPEQTEHQTNAILLHTVPEEDYIGLLITDLETHYNQQVLFFRVLKRTALQIDDKSEPDTFRKASHFVVRLS